MMERKSKQLNMVMLDMEGLIPQDHLLAESYYSPIGSSSIDPVCVQPKQAAKVHRKFNIPGNI